MLTSTRSHPLKAHSEPGKTLVVCTTVSLLRVDVGHHIETFGFLSPSRFKRTGSWEKLRNIFVSNVVKLEHILWGEQLAVHMSHSCCQITGMGPVLRAWLKSLWYHILIFYQHGKEPTGTLLPSAKHTHMRTHAQKSCLIKTSCCSDHSPLRAS